jgi:SAM-dependent methyltransferase
MNPNLLSVLHCPACSGELRAAFAQPGLLPGAEQADHLVCLACGQKTPLSSGQYGGALNHHPGIPLFTSPPAGIIASTKQARGPEVGTPWRQANWRFLEEQLARLPSEALILDVGAGRGDFAQALAGRRSLALDVYPYPEVDVVCDLTLENPFRPASFEAILLLNVMEHIYDSHALLTTLVDLLKPGGVLIVAIPFMVKIHQAPVDFVRYTHYALERLGESHGLQVNSLEGFYDPLFFLGEGIGNLRNAVLPGMRASQRYLARALLAGIQSLAGLLRLLNGPGRMLPPSKARSMAPTGYHVVYRKPNR